MIMESAGIDDDIPDLVPEQRLNIEIWAVYYGTGSAFENPEGLEIMETLRRSECVRNALKQHEDYVGEQELDKVLDVKKGTSEKDRRKRKMAAT